MKKALTYLILILVLSISLTCRKKTTVDLLAYNYALDEPMAGAKVALIEIDANTVTGNNKCKEIATKIVDSNGRCNFDKEKLKTNKSLQYSIVVVNAYNMSIDYGCGLRETDLVKVGSSQEIIPKIPTYTCNIKLVINNLYASALPTDTFKLGFLKTLYHPLYDVYPRGEPDLKGTYYSFSLSYPKEMITEIKNVIAGKYALFAYKRKLGITTVIKNTLKIYPNETKTIAVDW